MLKEAGISICINKQQIGGSGSEQVVGSNSVLVAPTCTEKIGIYVGEGMTPVPKKLAEKIWQWEFVDGWAEGKSEDSTRSSMALTHRKYQVTDVDKLELCVL